MATSEKPNGSPSQARAFFFLAGSASSVLVDGNPLESTGLAADPDTNFSVFMKDGAIYKNSVSR